MGQLQMLGRALGEQGEGIEPDKAHRKDAFACADFLAAALQRRLERSLPGLPFARLHEQAGTQGIGSPTAPAFEGK
jgi:hypothetical protein